LAKVSTKGTKYAIVLDEKDFKALGLDADSEYDFKSVRTGVWAMVKKEAPKQEYEQDAKETKITKGSPDKVEEHIIGLLKKKPLNERVEEKFEKLLNEHELKKFKELLKEGKVVKYRLNKEYRKAVYKLKEDAEKSVMSSGGEIEKADYEGKPNYDIYKDGFAVYYDESSARAFSEEHRTEMKTKEIIGIKTFDGSYFFINTELFKKKAKPVLAYLEKKKGVELNDLGKAMKNRMLGKIVVEFLKEEGFVMEKRKDFYEAV